jgi:hypothetical protein
MIPPTTREDRTADATARICARLGNLRQAVKLDDAWTIKVRTVELEDTISDGPYSSEDQTVIREIIASFGDLADGWNTTITARDRLFLTTLVNAIERCCEIAEEVT